MSVLRRNVRSTKTNPALDSLAPRGTTIPWIIGFTGNNGDGWVGWFANLNAAIRVRQTPFDRLDGTLIAAILHFG